MTLALTSLSAVCPRTFFFLGQKQRKSPEREGEGFRQASARALQLVTRGGRPVTSASNGKSRAGVWRERINRSPVRALIGAGRIAASR